jgi:hypothetical protein
MTIESSITTAVAKTVNRHGYGLQYALIRAVDSLFDPARGGWRSGPPEFPVEFRNKETKIDAILEYHPRVHPFPKLLMAVECKRVNPALGSWCFFRSARIPEEIEFHDKFTVHVLEDLGQRNMGFGLPINLKNLGTRKAFHLGLPIKGPKSGDNSSGSDRDSLENACYQAIQGANGLIEQFRKENPLRERSPLIGVVPVIFTTADLITYEIDLGTANLSDGELDFAGAEAERPGWLTLHYPASKSLEPTGEILAGRGNEIRGLWDFQYRNHIRTIAIVSPSGLREFLEASFWTIAEHWRFY